MFGNEFYLFVLFMQSNVEELVRVKVLRTLDKLKKVDCLISHVPSRIIFFEKLKWYYKLEKDQQNASDS